MDLATRNIPFISPPRLRMSSYLVAVLVGHFESNEGESDGIPIRVWFSPGKKDLANFALEAAKFNLSYYDKYFGIKYPLRQAGPWWASKISPPAPWRIPAALSFRDMLLLLDEKHSALDMKKLVYRSLLTKWLTSGSATS